MATRRQRKVAELLHQEVSEILDHDLKDPRLGFVTVTGVEITADFRQAKIFVTVLGDSQAGQQALAGLASASGYLRHRLGQTVALRHVPELIFKLDTSLAHGLHIEKLLDEIKADQPLDPPGESESDG
jgi:ribosome-binding factor A